MRLAAIDIGSNSVHMIVVETSDGVSFEVIDREKEMIKLGSGAFRRGRLTEEAFAAGLDALGKFKKLAERWAVDEVVAAATSAVREAENGRAFLSAVYERTGIPPRIISGEEEARLIYLGVRDEIDLSGRRALILDIGGGTVEVIVGNAAKVVCSSSLKLGTQRLRDMLGNEPRLSRDSRRRVEQLIRERSHAAIGRARAAGFDLAIGTAGTILALGTAVQSSREEDAWRSPTGRTVGLDELRELVEGLAEMDADERARVPGIDAHRSDTIHLGGLVLVGLLEAAEVDRLTLCDSSVREGMVLDYLERSPHRDTSEPGVTDLRRRSVVDLARRYGQAGPHAERVAALALQLFDQTAALHGLSPSDRGLLEYACLLHDVGKHIAFEKHEHHSHYLIRNADLRGFTEDETRLMALVARYHRRGKPKLRHAEFAALRPRARRVVRLLAAILRLVNGLDRSHFQVVRALRCQPMPARLRIGVVADGDAELELWAARREAALLARVLKREIELEPEADRVEPLAGP